MSYLEHVLPPEEALKILPEHSGERSAREAVLQEGYPGYDTSVGWFNYEDARVKDLASRALQQGFRAFKLKVGSHEPARDVRRATMLRQVVGPDPRRDGDRLCCDASRAEVGSRCQAPDRSASFSASYTPQARERAAARCPPALPYMPAPGPIGPIPPMPPVSPPPPPPKLPNLVKKNQRLRALARQHEPRESSCRGVHFGNAARILSLLIFDNSCSGDHVDSRTVQPSCVHSATRQLLSKLRNSDRKVATRNPEV